EAPEHARILGVCLSGLCDGDRIVAEVRRAKIFQEDSAVGMRVRAHAPRTGWGKIGQSRRQRSVAVEQLLGAVTLHPLLEHLEVCRILPWIGEWHLVSAERSFDVLTINEFWSRPAFGRG